MSGAKIDVESRVSLIQLIFLKNYLLSTGKHKERQCLIWLSRLFQSELNSRSFVPVAVLLSDSFVFWHLQTLSWALLTLLWAGICPWLGVRAQEFLLGPSQVKEGSCSASPSHGNHWNSDLGCKGSSTSCFKELYWNSKRALSRISESFPRDGRHNHKLLVPGLVMEGFSTVLPKPKHSVQFSFNKY